VSLDQKETQEQPLPSLGLLGLRVFKELMAIQDRQVRLLLFRAHKDLKVYRASLEKRQQFQDHKDRPVPPALRAFKVLKAILVQRVLRARWVRKVQLALMGLQDLRAHPAQKDWIRQYRALQGLPDLRD
jgi:hypothetical protein